ncbi:hypothetical protein ACLKA6_010284 [Drosophila palustris]
MKGTEWYNMGNCSYADKVSLNYVCSGEFTKDLNTRWNDKRVNVGTDYTVWASSEETDAIVMVSFKKSDLFDYKTIKVNALDYKIFGVEDGKETEINFKKGSVNCFSYGVRYVSDLKNNCQDRDNNPDDICNHPILHYSNPEG